MPIAISAQVLGSGTADVTQLAVWNTAEYRPASPAVRNVNPCAAKSKPASSFASPLPGS